MIPPIVTTTPAPYCPLPDADRRRPYVKSDKTDILRTISEHSRLAILDDYDRTDALGHLELPGAFAK
jgi:hypothetical protein